MMARPSEQGDRSELGPGAPFSNGTAPSQFAPSQHHPYYGTEYPSPLDHEMTMAEPFSQSNQTNALEELQNAAAAVRNNSHAMSVNTNGSTSTAMGPPHTPRQTSPPAGDSRQSVDFTPDGQGGLKRKRSKVSRACDECRRKKVKCDADDGEGAEIKTCSNCEKAGMKCEFSRVPMRRGPSKGYINALASRVERVEQEQAAIHRLSMDASTMDAVYSPEEVLSGKRQFSFSDSRSPFGPADYQRDRMPSSAWNTGNTPTSANFRARDRGSLAIAPDQHFPTATSYPTSVKPFWSDFEDPPPAKRQKLDTILSSMEPIDVLAEDLDGYYASIHPELCLLPEDRAIAVKIIQKAAVPFQYWFYSTLNQIPSENSFHHKMRSESDSKQPGERPVNKGSNKVDPIQEEILDLLISPEYQSNAADWLLWVWASTIRAVLTELNLPLTFSKSIGRTRMLEQAADHVKWFKDVAILNDPIIPDIDNSVVKGLSEKAWNIILTLDRYHSLATGGGATRWSMDAALDIDTCKDLAPITDLICMASNPLVVNIMILQARPTQADSQWARFAPFSTSRWVAYCAKDAGLDQEDLTVRKLKVFYSLILSYFMQAWMPDNIIRPTSELAVLILQSNPAPANKGYVYSLLDMHIFAVTAFTLIEFLNADADPDFILYAKDALGLIQTALEQKVQIYSQAKSELPTTPQPHGLLRDANGHLLDGVSWMEVLLKYIQDKSKAGWWGEKEGDDPNRPSPHQALHNVSELLKKGYLVVLANMAQHYAEKGAANEQAEASAA